MLYDITYTCGHSARVQIYGSASDRARKADAEEAKLCRACYLLQQRRAAQSEAESNGLPTLTGTEKQVDFALVIRAQFVRACTGLDAPDTFAIAVDYVIGHITHSQASAAWWIDRREKVKTPMQIMREYMQDNPDVAAEAKRRASTTQEGAKR